MLAFAFAAAVGGSVDEPALAVANRVGLQLVHPNGSAQSGTVVRHSFIMRIIALGQPLDTDVAAHRLVVRGGRITELRREVRSARVVVFYASVRAAARAASVTFTVPAGIFPRGNRAVSRTYQVEPGLTARLGVHQPVPVTGPFSVHLTFSKPVALGFGADERDEVFYAGDDVVVRGGWIGRLSVRSNRHFVLDVVPHPNARGRHVVIVLKAGSVASRSDRFDRAPRARLRVPVADAAGGRVREAR